MAAGRDPSTHVARSDCECIHDGPIGQPVNTVSSLAYSVAGLWVWKRGRGVRGSGTLAAAAVAAGLGSAAYHGPGGPVGKAVHDASALAFAAALTIGFVRRAPRPLVQAMAAGCFVAAVPVHALSRTDRPLCRPDSALQGHAAWHLLGALAAALTVEAHRPWT